MSIGAAFDQMLARAQAGDHDALTEIYRDVAPLVVGYLRANQVPDPEDVAGDVFVSMVTGLAGFAGNEANFRSWLLTIAHRRLIDEHRRRARRRSDPMTNDDIASSSDRGRGHRDGDTVGAEVVARDQAAKVIAAIDQLSVDQRAVVLLRVFADLPVADTARITGKTQTAVKATLRRALRQLRQATERDGGR